MGKRDREIWDFCQKKAFGPVVFHGRKSWWSRCRPARKKEKKLLVPYKSGDKKASGPVQKSFLSRSEKFPVPYVEIVGKVLASRPSWVISDIFWLYQMKSGHIRPSCIISDHKGSYQTKPEHIRPSRVISDQFVSHQTKRDHTSPNWIISGLPCWLSHHL